MAGVVDANVDMTSMELVISGDKIDLQKIIEALKKSGFDASRKP